MATSQPRISIIMVDGAFRQSYHAVDFFCTQNFPADDFELLWVEFSDTVHPELAEAVARYSNARIITLNQTGDYHPALCFNAGIEAARGELLVIPDADQACEADTLQRIWDAHQRDERLVMYLFRYDEPEDQHIEPVTLNLLPHLRDVCFMRSPSNFGACLTLRRRWMVEINGYDRYWPFHTDFHAHGLDVSTRLKNLGLPIAWHPEIRLYHSWHPNTKLPAKLIYGRQQIVVNWRARALATTTFDGLDPARNIPVPDGLIEEIAEFEAKQRAREARRAEKQRQREQGAERGSLRHVLTSAAKTVIRAR